MNLDKDWIRIPILFLAGMGLSQLFKMIPLLIEWVKGFSK